MWSEKRVDAEGFVEPRSRYAELAQEVFSRVETTDFEEDPAQREAVFDRFVAELLSHYQTHCPLDKAKEIIRAKYDRMSSSIDPDNLDEKVSEAVLKKVGQELFEELGLIEA